MELPEPIKEQFEKNRKSYELYKGNRTLCWTPLNGKVCVAQATIIFHFKAQSRNLFVNSNRNKNKNFRFTEEWHLEKLSAVTNVPPSVLRKRIAF
jgi:hypothetical protein